MLLPLPPAFAEVLVLGGEVDSSQTQSTNVSQLLDIQPADWVFQALQSLDHRYSCISNYPNNNFRSTRALPRNEFAIGLNACLNWINQLIDDNGTESVSEEDLQTLKNLQKEFAIELIRLRNQANLLEARTTTLETNSFSTTTNLETRIVLATNAGNFTDNQIIDPTGNNITREPPNPTALYQLSLDLNTSFSGQDLIKIRLDTVSSSGSDSIAGSLEPYLGSASEFSVRGSPNNQLGIGRLYYSFTPVEDLQVSLGSAISVTDYIDFNSYANGVPNFSTLALVNNYILFPLDLPSAGAAVEWNLGQGPFILRAVYTAVDTSNPNSDSQSANVPPLASLLYPNQAGKSGLFRSTYQTTVELEYFPFKNFALRLQFGSGKIFDNHFDAFGANFELSFLQGLALYGRYGFGSYNNTAFGDIKPKYWMVGVAFTDLFKQGSLAGIAAARPFIASEIGTATQTNFEAFYNFTITDNIQIAPLLQVIVDAGNQDTNSTIVVGAFRTVFSF